MGLFLGVVVENKTLVFIVLTFQLFHSVQICPNIVQMEETVRRSSFKNSKNKIFVLFGFEAKNYL